MSRGIIYVRVSSDEQVKGMSLDFQKQDCRAYAEKKQIEIDEVFEEKGESAKFADRPELIRLLEYCQKRRQGINTLIIWKLDRLSRNQLDYYYLKRKLRDCGVGILSATEPSMEDSDSLPGKICETFSALQAEIDNSVRRERTLRGMQAKIEAGIYPWHPPLGYRCQQAKKHGEKKTRADAPDPVLFPILQEALREYARGGASLTEMAILLDKKGLSEARGQKTRPQIVDRILFEYIHFYGGWIRNPWSGEMVRGAHQPLLTETEYCQILETRDGKKRKLLPKYQQVNPTFPLRRLVICPHCGRFYTGSVSRGNGGAFAYYHCHTLGCPAYGKSIRKKDLEDQFATLANSYLLTEKFLVAFHEALEMVFREKTQNARKRKIFQEQRLQELQERRQRLFEMREDGSYNREEFQERKIPLEAEMATLKREMAEEEPACDWGGLIERAREFVRNFGQEWSTLPFDIQVRFQHVLFPEGISYDRKEGFGTAKVGPVFDLFRDFQTGKSLGVTPGGFGWNQVEKNMAILYGMVA